MTLTSVKLCTLHQNVENISTHTVCVAKKCHLKFGCMVHGEVSPAVFSEAFLGDFFPLRVREFTKINRGSHSASNAHICVWVCGCVNVCVYRGFYHQCVPNCVFLGGKTSYYAE